MEMTRRAVVAVGSVLMGPGNWSMSVKLEKASSASTGRHVNVAEPLRWVHYGPSHAAFSHQKSHQCIKRYSLGIDKLMLSFFPDWLESLLNSVMGGNSIQYYLSSSFSRKTSYRKMEIIYCNTIVFSKTISYNNLNNINNISFVILAWMIWYRIETLPGGDHFYASVPHWESSEHSCKLLCYINYFTVLLFESS